MTEKPQCIAVGSLVLQITHIVYQHIQMDRWEKSMLMSIRKSHVMAFMCLKYMDVILVNVA